MTLHTTTDCRACGAPIHFARSAEGRHFWTNGDGSPHECVATTWIYDTGHAQTGQAPPDGWRQRAKRAEAEVARLRAALERLADEKPFTAVRSSGALPDWVEEVKAMQTVARAALDGECNS